MVLVRGSIRGGGRRRRRRKGRGFKEGLVPARPQVVGGNGTQRATEGISQAKKTPTGLLEIRHT